MWFTTSWYTMSFSLLRDQDTASVHKEQSMPFAVAEDLSTRRLSLTPWQKRPTWGEERKASRRSRYSRWSVRMASVCGFKGETLPVDALHLACRIRSKLPGTHCGRSSSEWLGMVQQRPTESTPVPLRCFNVQLSRQQCLCDVSMSTIDENRPRWQVG